MFKLVSIFLFSLLYLFSPLASAKDSLAVPLIEPWKKFNRDKANDLLTASLGLEGLQNATPPPASKLRQLAYYSNIRALVDTTSDGGFGRIFGPKQDQIITGVEYLAATKLNKGTSPAVYSIQIPDNFNQKSPCIVVSASSGSRGVYGAVGVTGFWALPKGCAVAYTNKGTGTGFYFQGLEKTFNYDGTLTTPASDLHWANLDNAPKNSDAIWVATRHAHSGNNPQKDWGKHTLFAAELALQALSNHFNREFNSDNTFIIAAAISNGGAAVLMAGEQDRHQLIDAIVAGEPNVSVGLEKFKIEKAGTITSLATLSGYETFNIQGVFSPCANLAVLPDTPETGVFRLKAQLACKQLIKSKLINAQTVEQASLQAQTYLVEKGLTPESLWLGPMYTTMGLWQAIDATYASSYSGLALFEDPCGSAYQLNRDSPVSTSGSEQLEKLWGQSSGIPPTAGITIANYKDIRDEANALKDLNQNFATSLCYFSWLNPQFLTQFDLDKTISPELIEQLKSGMHQAQSTANLQGKPTIIVHGQSDRLVLVNHSSRPYYWKNQTTFGKQSQLRYLEIEHAQHFEALLPYPPYNGLLIPLHVYLEQALDAIWNNHYHKKPLPESVVVKPLLRQIKDGSMEPLNHHHLPSIFDSKDRIEVTQSALKLP